jgi:hypothetical protein
MTAFEEQVTAIMNGETTTEEVNRQAILRLSREYYDAAYQEADFDAEVEDIKAQIAAATPVLQARLKAALERRDKYREYAKERKTELKMLVEDCVMQHEYGMGREAFPAINVVRETVIQYDPKDLGAVVAWLVGMDKGDLVTIKWTPIQEMATLAEHMSPKNANGEDILEVRRLPNAKFDSIEKWNVDALWPKNFTLRSAVTGQTLPQSFDTENEARDAAKQLLQAGAKETEFLVINSAGNVVGGVLWEDYGRDAHDYNHTDDEETTDEPPF